MPDPATFADLSPRLPAPAPPAIARAMAIPLPPVRRIVFSREGFDTAAGGCPSPVVDGRPVSLPIPAGRYPGVRPYADLAGERPSLVRALSRHGDGLCHLDPDLDPAALPIRSPDWRPAFGQVGAAQGHLRNQGVGAGDLFLFFGLFRTAGRVGQGWSWTGPAFHAVFGWLRVGELVDGPAIGAHPALAGHPHAAAGWPASNTVYVSADRLGLPGAAAQPGAGVFARAVRLTAADVPCSLWAVPPWLEASRMSYRGHDRFWPAPGRMDARGQWQEAVAPADDEGLTWAATLIASHAA